MVHSSEYGNISYWKYVGITFPYPLLRTVVRNGHRVWDCSWGFPKLGIPVGGSPVVTASLGSIPGSPDVWKLQGDYGRIYKGYMEVIGSILWIYRDSGKENGNCRNYRVL